MEQQDVFSVFGAFGPGGMTTAVINRSNMFAEAGHRCRVVTLDFGTGPASQTGSDEVRNRLDSSVEVLNPFAAARQFNTVEHGAVPDPALLAVHEEGRGVQADEFDTKHYARYFFPDGNYEKYKKWTPDHSRLVSVDYFNQDKIIYRREEFDDRGILHREVGFVNGQKNRERYLTADGFCYLVRWYDPETGKGQSVYLFNRGREEVVRYPSCASWRMAWLQDLLDACPARPLVLADGRFVMPQLFKLDAKSRTILAVMHSNHYAKAPFAPGSPIKDFYAEYLDRINEVDGVVALTRGQAQDVDRETGHTGKVHAIPNAISPRPALPSVSVPGRVGMFGRIIRSKGHLEAIRAWPEILRHSPDAELHIFGSAPTVNDPYLGEVEASISDLGLSRSVKLRGYTHDVATEMAACSVTLLPSTTEGMPFAVVESMLAETPVIAYNCNYGPRDLITDEVDGYLVPVADRQALAARVCGLLDDIEMSRMMGRTGRKKLVNEYSQTRTLARWENLFQLARTEPQ
jgi:Glycosyltransferase